jgi:hypothetical protein
LGLLKGLGRRRDIPHSPQDHGNYIDVNALTIKVKARSTALQAIITRFIRNYSDIVMYVRKEPN